MKKGVLGQRMAYGVIAYFCNFGYYVSMYELGGGGV